MNLRFDFYTSSEISEILGERLNTQRLALNLTQAALAGKAGTGISTVARIESSQSGILDSVIRLIMDFDRVNHFSELFDVVPANIEEVIAKQNIRLYASNKSWHKVSLSMYQPISIANIYYQEFGDKRLIGKLTMNGRHPAFSYDAAWLSEIRSFVI